MLPFKIHLKAFPVHTHTNTRTCHTCTSVMHFHYLYALLNAIFVHKMRGETKTKKKTRRRQCDERGGTKFIGEIKFYSFECGKKSKFQFNDRNDISYARMRTETNRQ